jgi:hypothetical protein
MLTFNWITFYINLFAIVACSVSTFYHIMEADYFTATVMGVLSLLNVVFAVQTVQRIYAMWDEE